MQTEMQTVKAMTKLFSIALSHLFGPICSNTYTLRNHFRKTENKNKNALKLKAEK